MTIEAKIIKDSVGPNGVRLTTYVLKYPRFIHSELMTHRMFSRNASSSRAIPVKKSIELIETQPAEPLAFLQNKAGMQGGQPLENQDEARKIWLEAKDAAIKYAKQMADLGVHKQYANRILEPYSFISVVVSATEYSNFFALRHHSMAQPEIAALAKLMWDEYTRSEPTKLEAGDWHLPFVSQEEVDAQWDSITEMAATETDAAWHEAMWLPLIKMSVARCARVSYLNHDGTKPDYEADCKLYDRLLGQAPIHASPAEHQAQARTTIFLQYPEQDGWHEKELTHKEYSGNFRGWKQYRKTLDNENITEFKGPLE